MTGLTSSTVFEQYHERVYRYILQLVRVPAEAEDLTQETFLRVHQRLGSLQEPAALQTWLYRIATNLCYDRFRKSDYRRPAESLDANAEAPGREAVLADRDRPRLDQVIERAKKTLQATTDAGASLVLIHTPPRIQ